MGQALGQVSVKKNRRILNKLEKYETKKCTKKFIKMERNKLGDCIVFFFLEFANNVLITFFCKI